jgi:hypothetical protein
VKAHQASLPVRTMCKLLGFLRQRILRISNRRASWLPPANRRCVSPSGRVLRATGLSPQPLEGVQGTNPPQHAAGSLCERDARVADRIGLVAVTAGVERHWANVRTRCPSRKLRVRRKGVPVDALVIQIINSRDRSAWSSLWHGVPVVTCHAWQSVQTRGVASDACGC